MAFHHILCFVLDLPGIKLYKLSEYALIFNTFQYGSLPAVQISCEMNRSYNLLMLRYTREQNPKNIYVTHLHPSFLLCSFSKHSKCKIFAFQEKSQILFLYLWNIVLERVLHISYLSYHFHV